MKIFKIYYGNEWEPSYYVLTHPYKDINGFKSDLRKSIEESSKDVISDSTYPLERELYFDYVFQTDLILNYIIPKMKKLGYEELEYEFVLDITHENTLITEGNPIKEWMEDEQFNKIIKNNKQIQKQYLKDE